MSEFWKIQVRALAANLLLVGVLILAAGLDPWWWI